MKKDPCRQDMSEIVRTVALWLKGFILIYGIYVVLYGHITPGGGFAGGVIIACGLILPVLARGQSPRETTFGRAVASFLDSAGVLLFLALAATGMVWTSGAFFQNLIATPEEARFTLLSGGFIPIANFGLGLKVASALFLVFLALAGFPIEPPNAEGDEEGP
jgi:multicomponent Na+:H+ antiporter subunit B